VCKQIRGYSETDRMISLTSDFGHARGIYLTPDRRRVFACYVGYSGLLIQ
jgi:hypothetical protein